jgi:hypothetical protein
MYTRFIIDMCCVGLLVFTWGQFNRFMTFYNLVDCLVSTIITITDLIVQRIVSKAMAEYAEDGDTDKLK